MEVIIKLSALVLICLPITRTAKCGNGICFSWSISIEQLTLICKVGKLGHRVMIYDPHGNIQADCLPPIPKVKCESHCKNGLIWQNGTTNETFFTVNEHIDNHLNGKWTCKHGTQFETADVEVTVLTVKENVTMIQYRSIEDDKVAEKYQCLKDSLLFTTAAFLTITTISLVCTSIFGVNVTFIDDVLRQMSSCGCINAKVISSIKKVVFLAITMFFFCTVSFVAWNETHCDLKWIFFACSCVVSLLNSVVFLSGEAKTDTEGRVFEPREDEEEDSEQL